MERYYFDLADGSSDVDVDGTELVGMTEARLHAVEYLGRVLHDDPERLWEGHDLRIEVTDQTGGLVATVIVVAIDTAPTGRISAAAGGHGDHRVDAGNDNDGDTVVTAPVVDHDGNLRRLTRGLRQRRQSMARSFAAIADIATPLDCARIIARVRDERSVFTESVLFGEPAWNTLLALYIAEGEGRPMSFDAACDASGAPRAIATRWMRVLAQRYVAERSRAGADDADRYIYLTDLAITEIETFLRRAFRVGELALAE